jgi:signal transduction histidine kinase
MCRRLAAAPWPGPTGGPATVALDVTGGEHVIEGDAGLVERAIGNLVMNAARHGDGAGPVVLRLRAGDAGTRRVEVEDHGPGVPAAERARIFEPFARGTAARGAGAGLGLALCARVAAAHRGRVWVEDAAEHPGARFVLELPGVLFA